MTTIDPNIVFKKFVNDCSNGITAVFISKGAMLTVNSDFNIKTMPAAINFISTGGLESPVHIKVKAWENNPKPENYIPVYSWAFYSRSSYGYLAFFYATESSKWIIKSFKKNTNPDPRNSKLPNFAFKDLGLLLEQKREEKDE